MNYAHIFIGYYSWLLEVRRLDEVTINNTYHFII